MFRDLEKGQTPFTSACRTPAVRRQPGGDGQTFTGDGLAVSSSYFATLGIQPALGRFIGPDDDRVEGEGRVAVLSHAFWQDRFAGSPDVLTTPLVVNGQSMTIVGVAPRGFSGTTIGERPLVFVPIYDAGAHAARRAAIVGPAELLGVPVRAPQAGVTVEQARAALAPLYSGIVNQVEVPLQKNMSEQTMARFKTKPIIVEPGAHGQSDIASEASDADHAAVRRHRRSCC